ncbi:MAG: general secretion pathway protein GspB [Pseudomonadota bacterium]
MSLLLDALRKSEDQRRKGELPPLDQPLSASSASAPERCGPSLRSGLILLLIVIVLAISIGWWLNRPAVDESATEVALRIPAESGIADAVSPESIMPADERAAASAEMIDQPGVAASSAADETATEQTIEAAENRQTAPDQTPPQDVSRLAAVTETEPAAESGDGSSSIAAAASSPDQQHEPTLAVQSEPVESEGIGPDAVAQQLLEPSAGPSAQPVESVEQPSRSFVYAWELPLAVRQDLPDLDVAVHVFANDPANRFVLINGERYGEGDRLAPGIVLDEITREGAMVDFRNYRILLQ